MMWIDEYIHWTPEKLRSHYKALEELIKTSEAEVVMWFVDTSSYTIDKRDNSFERFKGKAEEYEEN